MSIKMYLIHLRFNSAPLHFHALINNSMADTRICEAVVKQASITLGNSNYLYGPCNKVLYVLPCVFKINWEGKVLSPVGSTIWVTVGVSMNECTVQMADTMELVWVGNAWLMSCVSPICFHVWDFPTVSTVQHPCLLRCIGKLSPSVYKPV